MKPYVIACACAFALGSVLRGQDPAADASNRAARWARQTTDQAEAAVRAATAPAVAPANQPAASASEAAARAARASTAAVAARARRDDAAGLPGSVRAAGAGADGLREATERALEAPARAASVLRAALEGAGARRVPR